MRVLFGVYGMEQVEARAFVEEAIASGIQVTDYECKHTKKAIEQYLEQHPDTDAVVLSEALETRSPYSTKDFEWLVERFEGVRIIPIVHEGSLGTSYLKELFHLGIFNAICAEDARTTTILDLLRAGRSRKSARLYYRISDVSDDADSADITSCIEHIVGAKDLDEQIALLVHVHERLSEEEFLLVWRGLSKEMREVFWDVPELEDIVPTKEIASLETEKEEVAHENPMVGFLKKPLDLLGKLDKMESIFARKEGTQTKSKVDKISGMEVSDLREILRNVMIGFVGTCKHSGATHQSAIAAHYLASYGYDVACVDYSLSGGKSFTAIQKYQEVDIEKDHFHFQGVDYYPDVQPETLNRVLARQYHFVIMDYGVFSPRVKADISRCSIKCAVGGAIAWERGALLSFVKETESMPDDFVLIVRGVEKDYRQNVYWLADVKEEVIFADYQEDPFDGTCYDGLKAILKNFTRVSNNTGNRIKTVEGKRKQEHSKAVKPKFLGTGTCFVTSLTNGCGNTHFSITLSNYLSKKGYSVALVSTTGEQNVQESLMGDVHIEGAAALYEQVCSDYQFIVFDKGNFGDLDDRDRAECIRADHKFMMCWSSPDYLTKLAKFVERMGTRADEWVYVFNHVPDKKIREISSLMAPHTCCFLPVYDAKNYPKPVMKILRQVLV